MRWYRTIRSFSDLWYDPVVRTCSQSCVLRDMPGTQCESALVQEQTTAHSAAKGKLQGLAAVGEVWDGVDPCAVTSLVKS